MSARRYWFWWLCALLGHRVRRFPHLTHASQMPRDWWQCRRCGNGWLSPHTIPPTHHQETT